MTPSRAKKLLWTEQPVKDATVIRLDNEALNRRNVRDLFSDNERLRFVQLVGEKRRTAFIAGRLAAKYHICSALDLKSSFPFRDIDIAQGDGGAPVPYLQGDKVNDLFVSISHGGAFALAGAVRSARFGLDVEPISNKCKSLKAAFATDEELAVLLDSVERKDEAKALTRLFSAKEAAAKGLGTHMYYAFHHYQLVAVFASALRFRDTSASDTQFSVETDMREEHIFSKLHLQEDRPKGTTLI